MPQTRAIISIENVVATATLNQKIDLDLIVRNFPHAEYQPKRFPGLVFRLKSPKTGTLIFHSGKMVCTGARSEELAATAIKTVVHRLRKGGVEVVNEPIIEVQNVVASINLGGRIIIEEAAKRMPKCIYEPEQFPALILRIIDPRTVFLIFSNGKLVCTGAKKEADVYKAVNTLHSTLEEEHLIVY